MPTSLIRFPQMIMFDFFFICSYVAGSKVTGETRGGRREPREDLAGPLREDRGSTLVEGAASFLAGVVADFFDDTKDSKSFAVFAGLKLLQLDSVALGTAVERLSCFIDLAGTFDLAAGFFLGLDSTCVCG
jgi:hypothetical protein